MNEKALMAGFFGARGTGKTIAAKRWIAARKPPRLIVWDYKHDPGMADLGRPITELPALCAAMKAPRFQLRYLVNFDGDVKAQFDVFCRAAWLAGDLTMFVDEVPEVTAPGRAPAAWKKCVNVGREYTRHDGQVVGLTILGAGQRAAEVDKSFLSNLDVMHCGRMGHDDDAKAVAKKLGCSWLDLMQLPDLHWIERTNGEPATRGVLSFRNTAKKVPAPARPAKAPQLRTPIS
ncbi:MAG: hypothetical protein JWQ72_2651 [Polaromonas sp.]|nr:hypothetical protein [Polaromonas sp.]